MKVLFIVLYAIVVVGGALALDQMLRTCRSINRARQEDMDCGDSKSN